MSDMSARLPPELKVLHEGFLATGVQGWGNARQYATVCETHPDRVTDFLRVTDQEQQRQQRRRDAELREELEQKLVEEERRRSVRLLAARRYEKEQRQARWQYRQHGLVAAARTVFRQEERRGQTEREQRRRRKEPKEERAKPLQRQKQQRRAAKENVPQRGDFERGDSAAASPLTPPSTSRSTALGLRSAALLSTSTTAATGAPAKASARPSAFSSPSEGQQREGEAGKAPVLSLRHLDSGNLAIVPFAVSTTAAAPTSPETAIDADTGDIAVTVAETAAAAEVDAIPQEQQQQQQQQQCELVQREGNPVDVDEQLAQQGIVAMRVWEAAAAVAEEVAAAAAAAGMTPTATMCEDLVDSDPGADTMAAGCTQDRHEQQEEQQLPTVGRDRQEDLTEAAAVSLQWKGCQPGATTVPDESDASDVDVGGGASDCSGSPPLKKRRTRSSSTTVEGTATTRRGKACDLHHGLSEQSLIEPPEELALTFEDSYSYILPIAEVLELTNNVPFDIEKLCAEGNYSGAGGQMLPYHGGSPSSAVEGSFEDEEEKEEEEEEEEEKEEEEKEEEEKEEEEKEEEEKVRSTATCRTLTDTKIMPPVTPVGRGGSAGPRTEEDKITGASSQSSQSTNPSGCGEGEPDAERKDTVIRRMSDRHRALLSEALVDWRQHRAQNLGSRFAPVLLPDAEIEEIADKVPTTTDDLRTVGTWRGSRKLANHGASLIAAIKTFLAVNKMAHGENIPCGGQEARARDEGMTRSPQGLPRRYRTRASLDDSRLATGQKAPTGTERMV